MVTFLDSHPQSNGATNNRCEKNGFVHHNGPQYYDANVSPIWGYQCITVRELKESMRDIIFTNPGIEIYINQAKVHL